MPKYGESLEAYVWRAELGIDNPRDHDTLYERECEVCGRPSISQWCSRCMDENSRAMGR